MAIRRLVRKEIATLRPYEAAEVPCRIKLDANESPYDFRNHIGSAFGVSTNRYPDPEAKEIRRLYGRTIGIRPEQILQGNGSDELIALLIEVFGGPVLYPVPTFSMYGVIAQILGQKKIEVPLDRSFDLDDRAMLRLLRSRKPALVFLSSPNNPTGNCFSTDRILRVVDKAPGIVVVDEAYHAFASDTGLLPLLKDYPNLVILRTLSKIGFAALRLGFLVGSAELVNEVNKVRLPFNVNALSQAVAVSALKEWERIRPKVSDIVRERDRLAAALSLMPGITAHPSEANFILFKVAGRDRVHRALLSQGILVRNMGPAVPGCLRVTVGTTKENNAFLRALARSLGKRKKGTE